MFSVTFLLWISPGRTRSVLVIFSPTFQSHRLLVWGVVLKKMETGRHKERKQKTGVPFLQFNFFSSPHFVIANKYSGLLMSPGRTGASLENLNGSRWAWYLTTTVGKRAAARKAGDGNAASSPGFPFRVTRDRRGEQGLVRMRLRHN